ncbi:DegT/DnrJ/EryC1/StrS family aminotransferase [Bradyrhizobium sp. HKCCYLS1011]|uniref:DegT/DnrJ/EryC1/StrS family aminotransferase n=1 Tax=Bradyrhizobium sp. HKCCYLS1011 TaxID=3420733 RepID=UPI003EBB3532
MKKIAFAGPSITEKEVDYVVDGVRNGFYDNYDAHIRRLEKAVGSYLGVPYVRGLHTCTAALHLAAVVLGIGPGDEVIVTDFSWAATAHAIAYTGAECVFVDIDPATWCIDPEAMEAAVTPKTKAIMLVHTFGHPARMDEIMAVARRHNLKVIEDAAPALGAMYNGQKVGTFGDISCFSFQGAKLTVSGEGGVICTKDEALYKRIHNMAWMGRTDREATFWCDAVGYQYTIANIAAALALAQVERVEELVGMKRRIHGWYSERLSGIEGVRLLVEQPGCRSNYCYPSLFLEDSVAADRDAIIVGLRDLNIHCRPGFPQMSAFPMYRQRFENPIAKSVWRRGISLPSALNLSEEDVDFVCRNFISLIGR